jgi:hypothetical protein
MRLCTVLLLTHSVSVWAAAANGTLLVSMQVLSSCATLVAKEAVAVSCPAGYPYQVFRTPSAQVTPDATQTTVQNTTQTVTIRY